MRGDIPAAIELLHPEFEMETPAGTPEEGAYKGYESAHRHLRDIMVRSASFG